MERMTLNTPVIALRGLTVFPDLTMSFDVEREISIYALDNAMDADRMIFLVTQRDIATALPEEKAAESRQNAWRTARITGTSAAGAWRKARRLRPQ